MAMFAIAAAALAVGATGHWSGLVFRTFYLFGAILNVPFLGLGEIYLLFGPRAGRMAGWIVISFALVATGILISSPFTHPLPLHTIAQGSHVFGVLPRVLAGVGSGGGAMVVFFGALYSVFRRSGGRFRLANILIALGTAISGASGLLNSVADQMSGFAIALTVGIAVIFLGFMLANSAPRPKVQELRPEHVSA